MSAVEITHLIGGDPREDFYPGHCGAIVPSVFSWNPTTIREVEHKSIRDFVEKHKQYLQGRVLDFGAGKPGTCREPQPYKDLVSGEYVPYDIGDPSPHGMFDAALCTQVIQYLPFSFDWNRLQGRLRLGGHLVLTGPTNWEEVEDTDLFRFTRAGIRRLLVSAGFTILICESRAEINLGGAKFSLGYGVVARV